jgi:hypothetical protein
MSYGEHPAERTENRPTTPAIAGTPALDRAHAFHEPADDCEQQVQAQDAAHQALHAPQRTAAVDVEQRALGDARTGRNFLTVAEDIAETTSG